MIVPFPPGGPTDVTARLFAQKLGEQWGQAVVVENRPGGNSALGAQQGAKSAPDGYTILVAMDTTMVMNPITTSDLPYNAFKDFAPISMMAQNTSLLVVRAEDRSADRAGPDRAGEIQSRQNELRRGNHHDASRRLYVLQDLQGSTRCSFPTRAAPKWCRAC